MTVFLLFLFYFCCNGYGDDYGGRLDFVMDFCICFIRSDTKK